MKKQIDQGAEATIYEEDRAILKERIKKSYRLSEIDEKLRKFRTRREAKVLDKLEKIDFPAPRLQAMCDQAMQLRMPSNVSLMVSPIFAFMSIGSSSSTSVYCAMSSSRVCIFLRLPNCGESELIGTAGCTC